MNGWIKLHRKIIDNPVFQDEQLLKLFIYCLVCAGHKQQRILFLGKEEILPKGSFITGRKELAKELKLNENKIYRGLKTLEDLNIISMQTNNKFTLINVVNYGIYQGTDLENEQPVNSGFEKVKQNTNGCTVKSNNKKEVINTDIDELSKKNKLDFEQPANNQRTTSEQPANTNKKYKNYKNDKNKDIKNKDIAISTPPKNEILQIYHETLPEHPQVKGWNEQRQRALNARWQEHPDLTWWKEYFNQVKDSNFLTGKVEPRDGRKPFMATLEWLINSSNMLKVIEGKYDDHKKAQPSGGYQRTEQEEAERKADIARWASMREEEDTPK